MSTKQNLKRNLRQILVNKNISRQELSEKLKIPIATIHEWCRGNNCPRADTLDKFAEMFNVSVVDLIKDDDSYNENLICNREFQQFNLLNIDNRKKVIEYMQFLRAKENENNK